MRSTLSSIQSHSESLEALFAGLRPLLTYLSLRIPEAKAGKGTIDDLPGSLPEHIRERYRTPAGTGQNEAEIMMLLIETVPAPPLDLSRPRHPRADIYYRLVRGLGITRGRDELDRLHSRPAPRGGKK
jgi:hypothetical protein